MALRIGIEPLGVRDEALSSCCTSRCWPVSVPERRSPANGPSYTISPPCVPAPGPMSTTWSAIAHHLRLVLDHEDGVALVAQALEQPVHLLHVVRVEADRRLVEDVGHIGQAEPRWRTIFVRCASPPDSVDDSRSRLEVAETDVDHRLEHLAQRARRSAATPGSSMPRRNSARSLICIAAQSAMFLPSISDERAAAFSRVPPHAGQALDVEIRSTAARRLGWSESGSLTRYGCGSCRRGPRR